MELLAAGFWVIRGGAAVRKVLGNCVFFRKINAFLGQRIMAETARGSSSTEKNIVLSDWGGLLHFGSVLVRQGRSTVKRFGCVLLAYHRGLSTSRWRVPYQRIYSSMPSGVSLVIEVVNHSFRDTTLIQFLELLECRMYLVVIRIMFSVESVNLN